jgi:hypothetical protein
VFEHPHAGGRVIVVLINLGDGFAQDIGRVHLVDGGLDLIVKNQDALVVGHEHAQVQITEQIHERQTAEINAGQAEPFYIISVGKSHGRILSNSTDFRKKKFFASRLADALFFYPEWSLDNQIEKHIDRIHESHYNDHN